MGGGHSPIPPMRRLRNLILFLVLALGLALAGFLAMNWKRNVLFSNPVKMPNIAADLEVGNLFLTEEKAGTVSWELTAKFAQCFKEGKRTLLEDLRVTLHNQDGRVVTLRGDRGRFDERTRNMDVEGGVVVTSSDGLCLRTDSLYYNHDRREITTEDPVSIDGQGLTVSGTGLLMDLSQERISILSEVETLIHEAPLDSG